MNLKTITFGVALCALFSAGPAIPAYAKGCDLHESTFAALSGTDDSQSYLEKLQAELKVRKELISNTILCAIDEGTILKASVDRASENNNAGKVGPKISALLGTVIEYYELQLEKVPDLGLEGSRYFSKDLLTWREGNYAPIAKTASDFIVWSGNQDLITTAQGRLNQIGGAVTILKLVDNQSIEEKWGMANNLFTNALAENKKAEDALQNLSPEEALASIKLTLESMADMYKTLSDLVTQINQLTSKVQSSDGK